MLMEDMLRCRENWAVSLPLYGILVSNMCAALFLQIHSDLGYLRSLVFTN